MENLLNCDGKRFACEIYGIEVTGIITVEDGQVYLCQNEKSGGACRDKKGYSYDNVFSKPMSLGMGCM